MALATAQGYQAQTANYLTTRRTNLAPTRSNTRDNKDIRALRRGDKMAWGGRAKDTDVVEDWEGFFQDCARYRRRQTMIWDLYHMYLQGDQWIYPSFKTNSIRRIPNTNRNYLFVDNQIAPLIKDQVARLLDTPQIWEIRPKTSEEEDILAAELGQSLLHYMDFKLNVRRDDAYLLRLVKTYGTAFVKVYWNPTASARVRVADGVDVPETDPQTGAPAIDWETGEVITRFVPSGTKVIDAPVGDAQREILTPYALFFPRGTIDFYKSNRFVHASVMALQEIRRRYPGSGWKALGEGIQYADEEQRLVPTNSIGSRSIGESLNTDTDQDDHLQPGDGWLIHKEGWDLDSDGVTWWVTAWAKHGKDGEPVLLRHEPYVFVDQKGEQHALPNPFIKYDDEKRSDTIWSNPTIKHLLHHQRMINKIWTRAFNMIERATNNPWFIPKSANPTPLTTGYGVIVKYDIDPRINGTGIWQSQSQQIPQDMVQWLQQLYRQFDRISGLYDVARGEATSRARTGKAITALQEQASMPFQREQANWLEGKRREGHILLELASHFYDEERVISIVDSGRPTDSRVIRGKDLRHNSDVEIIFGSFLPNSRSDRYVQLSEMYKEGLLGQPGSPEARDRFWKMMGLGSMENVIWDGQMHMRVAMHEHRQLVAGSGRLETMLFGDQAQVAGMNEIRVEQYHNHQIHIDEHEKWMNSAEFIGLPQHVQDLMTAHVDEHKLVAFQEAQLEARKMAMVQNAALPPQPLGQPGASPGPRPALPPAA